MRTSIAQVYRPTHTPARAPNGPQFAGASAMTASLIMIVAVQLFFEQVVQRNFAD
jgi:hypothetical protein